jgi:hypothetical protein
MVLLAAGCARVPEESVELSVTVGRDLAEAHRANRELARRYFERMRADVETFVSTTYRPYIIRQTMSDLQLVERIKKASADDSDLDPLDVMEVYVERTLSRVSAFRSALLAPVEIQERQVLTAIDETFQRLQNANAVVTGHLASVRRVREAQDEFLKGAGLGNTSEQLGGQLADFSDRLARTLEQGRQAEQLLDQGAEALPRVKQLLDSIPQRVREAAGSGGR